ncbi:unnamed protein product, partial [Amoebophrya sp. A25]
GTGGGLLDSFPLELVEEIERSRRFRITPSQFATAAADQLGNTRIPDVINGEQHLDGGMDLFFYKDEDRIGNAKDVRVPSRTTAALQERLVLGTTKAPGISPVVWMSRNISGTLQQFTNHLLRGQIGLLSCKVKGPERATKNVYQQLHLQDEQSKKAVKNIARALERNEHEVALRVLSRMNFEDEEDGHQSDHDDSPSTGGDDDVGEEG